MSVDDWADLFTETVTLKPFVSRDARGLVTFGTGTDFKARVIHKPTMVRNKQGSEVVSSGQVWIQGTPTVTPEDEITLPDASTPELLAAISFPDEDGAHHTKIFFA